MSDVALSHLLLQNFVYLSKEMRKITSGNLKKSGWLRNNIGVVFTEKCWLSEAIYAGVLSWSIIVEFIFRSLDVISNLRNTNCAERPDF